MKKIAFRAWDKEFKRMKVTGMGINGGLLSGEDLEIMQYIGLRDSTKWEQLTEKEQTEWLDSVYKKDDKILKHTKEDWHGKDIYEGDIISIDYNLITDNQLEHIVIGEVIFNTDITLGNLEFGLWTKRGYYRTDFLADIKVIGNIFETPELK